MEGPALATMESMSRRVTGEEGWEEQSACRGADVELFFAVEEEQQKEALEFCARCDVRTECLEYAIENREMYGIWGGMLESDRRAFIRDLRRREREQRERRKQTSAA